MKARVLCPYHKPYGPCPLRTAGEEKLCIRATGMSPPEAETCYRWQRAGRKAVEKIAKQLYQALGTPTEADAAMAAFKRAGL